MVEPWAGEEPVVLPLPHHGLYLTDYLFTPKVSVGLLNHGTAEPWAGVVLPLPNHGLYLTDYLFTPKVSVGQLNRELLRNLWSSLSLAMVYI
jgi:hypothetical protein